MPAPEVTPHRSPAQQSLALPAVRDARRPPPPPESRPSATGLWVCLYFPSLPLEASSLPADSPAAVFEEQQGICRILIASRSARRKGVEPGQSVNAALSLSPELALAERDTGREARLMQSLAEWADRYTSFVVIESGNVLLLDVAGSLRLFGGIERMLDEIGRSLAARGLTAVPAAAPTPLASAWLARAGRVNEAPGDGQRLAGTLAAVPLAATGWPAPLLERMQGMGLRQLGDCLRLPRQGFARRFGVARLNDLDRALGRLPDPREHHRAPERFSADFEFDAEEENSERILDGCRALLEGLERFLRSRQQQVQRLRVSFFHLREDATHLVLGCVSAGIGTEHWFDLLKLRFERLSLPAPVVALRLTGGRGEPGARSGESLPGINPNDGSEAAIGRLVERLSARMGRQVVHGIETVAEHRPQHAWRRVEPRVETRHCASPVTTAWNEAHMPGLLEDLRLNSRLLLRRPLWVLDEPETLAVRDGLPLYRGQPLKLDEPERLETGWWDEDGVARDYFVARSEDGICLWVFRDRQGSRDWYLHGLFG